MLLKKLINPSPAIIIFFIVFCISMMLAPLFSDYKYYEMNNYIIIGIGFLITGFHALGLNNLIYEKNIIKKDSLVIGFTYICLCSPFYVCLKQWIISFALLFYVNYLLNSYQKKYPFSEIFNSTLIISVLTFIDVNIIFLLPITIIAGINYENLNLRSILIICIGLLIPYLFYFVYSNLFNVDFIIKNTSNISIIDFTKIQYLSNKKIIWVATVFIIGFFSFVEIYNWLYKKSIRSRKSFIIILYYIIVTFLFVLFSNFKNMYYLITPLSIVIGNYFIYTKKRSIANLLFLLLLGSSFYYRLLYSI